MLQKCAPVCEELINRIRSEDSAMADTLRTLSSVVDDTAVWLGYTRLKVEQSSLQA